MAAPIDPARLDQIAMFADLTADERAEIAPHLREVTVEPAAPLAVQGDNAYELFVIEEGTAEVRKDGEFIRTLGVGDIFGEIGLIATGTRTASVVATSPMRVVAMFVSDFLRLERAHPEIAKALRAIAAERAARTSF